MTPRKTIRLLFIDDDKTDVDFYIDILRRKRTNYIVSFVEKPEDAKVLIQIDKFDCVIIDNKLPDTNGLEIIDTLRAYTKGTATAFVILTGLGNEYITIDSKHHGYIDYFPKDSITFHNLTKILKSSINSAKTQSQLKLANEQMQKFVGIVSHDLRGPLSVIKSATDLLKSEFKENNYHEIPYLIDMLEQTSDNALELIVDLLDLTALQSGKITIHLSPCHLSKVFNNTLQDFNLACENKKISICHKINSKLFVQADEKRLSQVLHNLISNAIKFSHENTSIQCGAEKESDKIKISISDAGIGIPQKKLPLLFSKSEDTSTQGTHGEPGTGFGLPLSQELIKAHDSEIMVESEEGQGSSFYFYLDKA